jgi:hypothetical protein
MNYLKRIERIEKIIISRKVDQYIVAVSRTSGDPCDFFSPIDEIAKEIERIDTGKLPEFYELLTESERKRYDPKNVLLKELGKIYRIRKSRFQSKR